MFRLFHRYESTPLRRLLRTKATNTEDILWQYLRQRRFHNLKFRRQESIGRYIVDFFCPERRLAIEVDGSVHDNQEQQVYDRERDRFLKACFIEVIRFKNNQVLNDIQRVLKELECLLYPPPKPPPKFGRGQGAKRPGVGVK